MHFDTLRVPLGGLKAASKVVSGRLNDGFVAGVTGGFRRYHQHHGYDHVDELRMAMPVNVRTAATATSVGNHFVPARFPVPDRARRPDRPHDRHPRDRRPRSGPNRRWR